MKPYKLNKKTWAIMVVVGNPRLSTRLPRIAALAFHLGFTGVYEFDMNYETFRIIADADDQDG